MKPRLSRPLLTAVVSGALVAGGAVYASPASAANPVAGASESASASPSESVPTSATPDPSNSTSATPDPSASASESASTSPSASVSPSPTTTTSPPPPADKTAPTGSFRLNSGGLWLGQNLVFNQNTSEFRDNVTPDNQIARKISWGDGTTTVLSAGRSTVNKRYARNGKFNVTVTLTDKAGNYRVVGPKSVTVTTPAKGTYSLSTKKTYQGKSFRVNVKKLPAGATGYVIDWADGTTSYHSSKTKSVKGFILYSYNKGKQGGRISGVRTVRISPVNRFGASVYQTAGKITLLKDNWRPKLSISKPGTPSRASSWRTLRGTASDKGAGLINNSVYLAVYRVSNSGAEYCITPKKKWKRVTTEAQFQSCFKNLLRVSVKKGKWSVTLPKGIAKGYIVVGAVTGDYADRSAQRTREARLTR